MKKFSEKEKKLFIQMCGEDAYRDLCKKQRGISERKMAAIAFENKKHKKARHKKRFDDDDDYDYDSDY